jgi:hypothetical protein
MLLTTHRLRQLLAVASAQTGVQAIGFLAGILLVRAMSPADYGYLTLALGLVGAANTLTDLGLSSAVLAAGGRLGLRGAALGELLADTDRLRRRIACWVLPVVALCALLLLWRLGAPAWQVLTLAALVTITSLFNVRSGIALSALRLVGAQVGYQQRLDLALNTLKLAAFAAAAAVALQAPTALAVIAWVGAVQLMLLARRLAGLGAHAAIAPGAHAAGLRTHVMRQTPNTLYYVLSSQIAIGLVSVLGTATHVAEVGALGRLAALFAIVSSVFAVLVQPFFAQRRPGPELGAVLVWVNLSFVLLLAGLLVSAQGWPAAFLWILGGHYGGLQAELPWMLAAATLSAWGGTLYSLGTVRGWILPAWLAATAGVVAVAVAASTVDPATVRGAFVISSAMAGAGVLVGLAFLAQQIRRHIRLEVTPA